jgi:beta-phosphoglucomutase-like phosphatase (HAD superfamily)
MATYSGFIFDVDGVLVDSPHERAWGDTLRHFMEGEWHDIVSQTTWTPTAYTTEVYQKNTAGKARREGALGLFHYFQIPDPTKDRLKQYCEAKQAMILELIQQGEFRAFDDATRLLIRAKECGAKIAAASSSKNANMMLKQAPSGVNGQAIYDLFDANVCGHDFEKGKPHPAIFLKASKELGIVPESCVVIEDAPSGVKAAKAGGMACIGIARLGDENILREAGADWVVNSLDLVSVGKDLSIHIG